MSIRCEKCHRHPARCQCGETPAASAGYVPPPGLISAVIRYDCIRNVGMVQDNNGDWVSVQNYCNLSRQLDSAVADLTRLKIAMSQMAEILPMGHTIRERKCFEIIQKALQGA